MVKEPTNILYANLYQDPTHQNLRKLLVFVIMFFSMVAACVVLFSTQKVSTKLSKFFPSVDCDGLKEDLQNDMEMMKEYAYMEWLYFMTMNENNISIEEISTSNLHCFCDDLREEVGYFQAIKVEHEIETEGGERFANVNGYLCRDYLEYSGFMYLLDLAVPFIIVWLNGMLLKITAWGLKWIQYETKSLEISKIQSVVFFLTFFNSAISILMINANFTGAKRV
jgi:hypothetical protein